MLLIQNTPGIFLNLFYESKIMFIIKSDKIITRKKKNLETGIFYKHKCKNVKQNFGK